MKNIFRLVLRMLRRQKRKTLSFSLFCLPLFLLLSLFWAANAGIQQGLEENLYQNVHNRMVRAEGGGPIEKEARDVCQGLPHVQRVLPNLSDLYCVGLGDQAVNLYLSPYSGEEKIRITAGEGLTDADAAAILLPEEILPIQAGDGPLDARAWVGRRIGIALSDYEGRRLEYQALVKGTYSREQLYYQNKGVYLSAGLWADLMEKQPPASLFLVADKAENREDIIRNMEAATDLRGAFYGPEADDGDYPIVGYVSLILWSCTASLSLILLFLILGRYIQSAAKGYALFALCGYGRRPIFLMAAWELSVLLFSCLLLSAFPAAVCSRLLLPPVLEAAFPNICIAPPPVSLLPFWGALALLLLLMILFHAWRLIARIKKEKAIQIIRA